MVGAKGVQAGFDTVAVCDEPGVVLFGIVLNNDPVNGAFGNPASAHEQVLATGFKIQVRRHDVIG